MFEILSTSFTNWNATNSERQKLQHAYLALSVVIVLVAGIITLFDANLGHSVVKLAAVAIVTFLVNAVVWNLLQSALLQKLSSKPKRK